MFILESQSQYEHSIGAAVGGHGMSSEDRQVCMVDDMEGLSPLAEAYARARGMCQKCFRSKISNS